MAVWYNLLREFPIFGMDSYPETQSFELLPMKILYASTIWGTNPQNIPPPQERISQVVNLQIPENFTGPVTLNVEQWQDIYTNPVTMNYMIEIVRAFKSMRPSVEFGFYSMFPRRDYINSLRPINNPVYKRWQDDNDAVLELAHEVDILYPSIYTFYPDIDRWIIYAKAMIREARRYNTRAKIYPYLWNRYHTATLPETLALESIDKDYFLTQLKVCYEYADGVVVWRDGSNSQFNDPNHDENSPWIQAILEFREKQRTIRSFAQDIMRI